MKTKTIQRVMTPVELTIGDDEPLERAQALMREHKLRLLPVLNQGKLVGVLDERDVAYLGNSTRLDGQRPLSLVMSRDVVTVNPKERLCDVARSMAEQRYSSAVVVDRGRVIGVFTANDALNIIAGAD